MAIPMESNSYRDATGDLSITVMALPGFWQLHYSVYTLDLGLFSRNPSCVITIVDPSV
jgi:hypothetical protein